MSNEKQLKQEIHRLNEDLKRLEEEKESQEHENKKAFLQANTKLDFQTRRADEYEEKYKSTLKYKNQEEEVKELDEKLRDKENQIIRLMRLDHDKSEEIKAMFQEAEQLRKNNNKLSSDLDQIKEAALNAIVDKDTTITELTQQIEEYRDSQNINNLKTVIIEMQQKYGELQEKLEATRIQYVAIIDSKDEEINQNNEKMNLLREKNDERIIRLEQQIQEYERHIEQITAERDHEQNFEEKYYHTEEKLRKTEKKVQQFQQKTLEERKQLVDMIEKLQLENENMKHESSDLKELKTKVAQFEKLYETAKLQKEQNKEKYQKAVQDNVKKISHIESEKKIINDNLKIKMQEIERLKAEIEEVSRKEEPSLKKQPSSPQKTPQKISEDNSGLIEKLKKQNRDLEQANESLKRKVEEQTKELQQSRQKLLQARSADSSAQSNKLRVQIEQLTSYLKKVENDMLMKKITHAEDENFWSIKEKKYKQEIQNMNKKYKKENSELLERIDRMKRLIPKDKKTDYYQSGFK